MALNTVDARVVQKTIEELSTKADQLRRLL
jgi:hypothetical protein